jgi:Amt family ammonium transporter
MLRAPLHVLTCPSAPPLQAYAQEYHWGAFYPGGGGRLLACQIVGVITIAAWVMVQAGLLFFVLRKLNMLRIPPEEEQMGLDVSKHGGAAYNYDGGRK